MLKLVSAAILLAITITLTTFAVSSTRRAGLIDGPARAGIDPTELMEHAPPDLPIERADAI